MKKISPDLPFTFVAVGKLSITVLSSARLLLLFYSPIEC